ncbi:pyridoxamine kinase [Lipomyces japonicus]|uniref:pyridoxamine kinase n=1 Tax=Lipomyces japonicus TaxID=56871 RepID=UPI0034CF49B7
MTGKTLPRVLTIAGSDSSGGAGIEADLKTITVHGCYGMTCITALTAQNTTGVKDIFPITSMTFIENALDAVFTDVGIDAVKTGMLASAETIKTVTKSLIKFNAEKVCVDPVMISTSGSHLLPEEAISAYLTDLFPIAYIITPNLHEAQYIYKASTGKDFKVASLQDAKNLARELKKLGPKYILLKGGHLPLTNDNTHALTEALSVKVADILYDGTEYYIVESNFIVTQNTHGTGCTLASSIASNLAKGFDTKRAINESIDYVHGAILDDLELGHGNGPINHLYKTYIEKD